MSAIYITAKRAGQLWSFNDSGSYKTHPNCYGRSKRLMLFLMSVDRKIHTMGFTSYVMGDITSGLSCNAQINMLQDEGALCFSQSVESVT